MTRPARDLRPACEGLEARYPLDGDTPPAPGPDTFDPAPTITESPPPGPDAFLDALIAGTLADYLTSPGAEGYAPNLGGFAGGSPSAPGVIGDARAAN